MQVFLVGHGDHLQDNPAMRGKQAVEGFEINRQVAMADRLEHLDRDYLAEPALDMAVIGEEDLDPVVQALFPDPPGCPVVLLC